MKTPMPGDVLRCEDGHAVVLASTDVTPVEGLQTLLDEDYDCYFPVDLPVLIEAAAAVKVETWRSCTKDWREGNSVDDLGTDGWWAPDGDGRRVIVVAWFDGDLYAIGDACAEALEALTGSSPA